MNFLAPEMLWVGLLAIPIILMYMLKLRHREKMVSSTFLWRQVIRDHQANTFWQRLKHNLLLLLQLLILVAIIFAIARPALPEATPVSGAAVFILDGSASMNATDVYPNRFVAASAAMLDLINKLPSNSPLTIILAGVPSRLLVSGETDRSSIMAALKDIHPDQGNADWATAFALAAGASQNVVQTTNITVTNVVITDGGLPQAGLPPLPGEIRYIPIGKTSNNLAISALAVRPANGNAQLFVSVKNFSSQPQTAVLSLYSGDKLFSAKELSIDSAKSKDIILEGLPQTPQTYQARLTPASDNKNGLDDLSIDDSAATVYSPASSRKILLVSKGNIFLRQLLKNIPGVQSFLADVGPDGLVQISKSPYDVYILDGIVPHDLPKGNLLIINPPENEFFNVTGVFSKTNLAYQADSPMTHYIKWQNVHISQAKKVSLPDWAQVLIEGEDGPLVFIGENNGRRLAIVTFDLHDSDLVLQMAYPILFSNLLQYLLNSRHINILMSGQDASQPASTSTTTNDDNLQISVGDSIQIRPANETALVRVKKPDGTTQQFTPQEGKVVFNNTDQLGIYTVTYPGSSQTEADAFAVNLFDPQESDIAPRASLLLNHKQIAPQGNSQKGQMELWPWFIALAILILTFEWWFYHRHELNLVQYWKNRLFIHKIFKRDRL